MTWCNICQLQKSEKRVTKVSEEGHIEMSWCSKGHLEVSGEGVRPICLLIESDTSLHVAIQIQEIEYMRGTGKMKYKAFIFI